MAEEPHPQNGREPAHPAGDIPEPPGLYVHIPFCLRKCPYCGFHSTTELSLVPAFRAALRREIALCRDRAAAYDTLYIGGGTPSVLAAEELRALIAGIRDAFPIEAGAEITLEANPADINRPRLLALRDAGVNRLNIGVQSFQDRALARLGRRHTARDGIDAVRRARDAGFANVGLDLIYALPLPAAARSVAGEADRDADAWLSTLEQAIALAPEHLSCYQLTIEAQTPFSERCRTGEWALPDEARQYDYFSRTAETLEACGYHHYEVSNFALPGRESRHNRKYWNHTPYLGLGPAAHSFAGRTRRWNRAPVARYIADLEAGRAPVESSETLGDEELALEALFLGFRTSRGICPQRFAARHGRDPLAGREEAVAALVRERLLEWNDGWLRPTRAGMAVADSLALL